jgi:hypothetical protein
MRRRGGQTRADAWKDENASINDPTLGPMGEQGQNDGIPAAMKGGIRWQL